jgi:enolase
MINRITSVRALEILDSRGNPTLRVEIALDSGACAAASVPSGASTGVNEAVELRDNDIRRFGGKGVLKAVQNVESEIAPAIIGHNATSFAELDRVLIDLDGTPTKSRLGANAVLGVSMAAARAHAKAMHVPLYRYLGHGPFRLPMPMFNVLNGGRHADSSLDFQEFMIVPVGAPNFSEALRYGAETFQSLRSLLARGGFATSVGDEGGFAPKLARNEAACELIVAAIEKAGYRPGNDIAIALDPAASSFFDGTYNLERSGEGRKTSSDLIGLYQKWVDDYPIVSIEDGLAESDWDGFHDMTASLGDRIQIVGDDIYVTNTDFIRRGIREKCSNAVLIKLNQIGTVSETIAAVDLCKEADWAHVVSHRSGETEDTFIADFAVAMGGGQIKAGSLCRGERIAKYNRLLEIERELGDAAELAKPFEATHVRHVPRGLGAGAAVIDKRQS